MSNHKIAIPASCLLILSLVCGCEQNPLGRNAISGTVTVDEASVAEGNIRFDPLDGTMTSGGAIIQDGKYSMERQKGLPAGKYRVVINAPVPGTGGQLPEGEMPGDELPAAKELIPAEWNEKSMQTIEVKQSGPFEFNFEISTKKI